MDKMGQDGDREHYIKVRQESRAIDLAKQNAKIANGIHLLEKHLASELLKGKKPEDLTKSPFVSIISRFKPSVKSWSFSCQNSYHSKSFIC